MESEYNTENRNELALLYSDILELSSKFLWDEGICNVKVDVHEAVF